MPFLFALENAEELETTMFILLRLRCNEVRVSVSSLVRFEGFEQFS